MSEYTPENVGDFQRIHAGSADNLTASGVALCGGPPGGADDVYPSRSVSAGPYNDCDSATSACTAGVTSGTCRALSEHNGRTGIVALTAKPGTYWAKHTAQPAWIQFRFPKPNQAASAEFRFELDERYAPTAGGGNPCNRAPGAQCTLCTTHLNGGAWDFDVAPGIRMLWYYHYF